MGIRENITQMKTSAPLLAAMDGDERNKVLLQIKEALLSHRDEIFAANERDLAAAEANGVSGAVMKRLKFDEGKLAAVTDGIDELVSLPDPIGRTTLHRELDDGLVLRRVTVPIGVIGVIFEARPDALVQISTLCIKSGNCAVLKGGKETAESNRVLFGLIRDAAVEAGLPENALLQAEAHSEIDELLKLDGYVDLIIPRGSNAFVRYIMDHTAIPVMGHADGVCHVYVDKAADMEKAVPIVLDAKLQYTAACNAVETLLVDRAAAKEQLPQLAKALESAGVRLRGTKEVGELLYGENAGTDEKNAGTDGGNAYETMGEEEFHTEYLEPVISVACVDGVKGAVAHVNRFGSHHTDAIVTEDAAAADYFLRMVDSAGVYHNASTRFADGFRYGFGAEVGISTSKLHARGPVGLDGLVTYKYLLSGTGQVVGDYASGKRKFHHKDLS